MDYGGNGLGAPSKRGMTAVGVTRIGLNIGPLSSRRKHTVQCITITLSGKRNKKNKVGIGEEE